MAHASGSGVSMARRGQSENCGAGGQIQRHQRKWPAWQDAGRGKPNDRPRAGILVGVRSSGCRGYVSGDVEPRLLWGQIIASPAKIRPELWVLGEGNTCWTREREEPQRILQDCCLPDIGRASSLRSRCLSLCHEEFAPGPKKGCWRGAPAELSLSFSRCLRDDPRSTNAPSFSRKPVSNLPPSPRLEPLLSPDGILARHNSAGCPLAICS